jgi:LacI family transcriptional regulator
MDGVSEAALWQPGLTTVSIERDSIGRSAGKLLMARLEEPDRPFERVIIRPDLVVRSSTGPAQGS